MNKLEKIIAHYYLAGVIALIIPIILIQNPYYILLTELIIYFILMIVKNMLPKRMQVKIIETTKKHTIIEINKSFSHPFAQGLYAVKLTKKKGIQTIKWEQTLFGSPKLTDFE